MVGRRIKRVSSDDVGSKASKVWDISRAGVNIGQRVDVVGRTGRTGAAYALLVCHTFDVELGAVGFVEEFGALQRSDGCGQLGIRRRYLDDNGIKSRRCGGNEGEDGRCLGHRAEEWHVAGSTQSR